MSIFFIIFTKLKPTATPSTFFFFSDENDFNLPIYAYSQFTLPHASCLMPIGRHPAVFLSKELIPGFLTDVLSSSFLLNLFFFFLWLCPLLFSLEIANSYSFPPKNSSGKLKIILGHPSTMSFHCKDTCINSKIESPYYKFAYDSPNLPPLSWHNY